MSIHRILGAASLKEGEKLIFRFQKVYAALSRVKGATVDAFEGFHRFVAVRHPTTDITIV